MALAGTFVAVSAEAPCAEFHKPLPRSFWMFAWAPRVTALIMILARSKLAMAVSRRAMDRRVWLAERRAAVVAAYDAEAPAYDEHEYPSDVQRE